MFVHAYGLTTNTMPTRIVCAHSHFTPLALRVRGNKLKVNKKDAAHRFKLICTIDINKIYSTSEVSDIL